MATSNGKTIKCKAAVVWEFKKPIAIETIEVLPPGKHEVRVKIVAVGLCHSDISALESETTSRTLKFPYIPGHEGAGIVESIGEGVQGIQPGDKVLTLFIPQCRQCSACKDRRTNICADIGRKDPIPRSVARVTGYDGNPKFFCKGQPVYMFCGCSSFAEYTVIPANSCIKIDPKAPLEKVCICACGFPTGYGAVTNAVQVRKGDNVAVWGVGGVGLAAVFGCKAKEAQKIIGIARSTQKELTARKIGCTDFIATNDLKKSVPEVVMEITKGEGVDFVFVCVGDVKAMEQSIMLAKPGGTIVLIGIPESMTPIQAIPFLFLHQRKLTGSFLGDYKVLDDIPQFVTQYLDGKIPLDEFITNKFKLEQIEDAISVMKSGKGIRSVILMD